MDFVKSGCEKSRAEVQADSFSFECRGCAKRKELLAIFFSCEVITRIHHHSHHHLRNHHLPLWCLSADSKREFFT